MKIIENIKNKYALTKTIKVADVKQYLRLEYKRANEREDLIKKLENDIKYYKQEQIKHEALLVIQEETTKRIEKQDARIKELKSQIEEYEKKLKLESSSNINIKANAEKMLKEKDKIIKELNKKIKQYEKRRGV